MGAQCARLCGDNFRSRVFYKLIEKADVPRFRFHDIRHTFASLLLSMAAMILLGTWKLPAIDRNRVVLSL